MIAPNDPREESAAAPASAPNGNSEFRVRLDDVFAGPLDLLLHLVKEQEVEITNVSLTRVCDDFLRYVRALGELDLARTGDYLVVAATLIAIKSRALVPTSEPVDLDGDFDPGDDLLKRLLQYRRVRDASRDLASRAGRRELLYSRGASDMPEVEPGEIELGDIGAWELLSAFARILQATGGDRPSHTIRKPDRSLRDYVNDVASALRAARAVRFEELFGEKPNRESVIGTFLAILELAKQGAIRVEQTQLFGGIAVARAMDDVDHFDRVVAGIADVDNESTEAQTTDTNVQDSDPSISTLPNTGLMVPESPLQNS
jgi:segregation and condensation protein A